MTGQQWFRGGCIALLWLLLCFIVVTSQPMSARVVFIIVASAIITFVPLYKKYVKGSKSTHGNRGGSPRP